MPLNKNPRSRKTIFLLGLHLLHLYYLLPLTLPNRRLWPSILSEFWCLPDFLFQTEQIAGPLPTSLMVSVRGEIWVCSSGAQWVSGGHLLCSFPGYIITFPEHCPSQTEANCSHQNTKEHASQLKWRTRNPAVPKLIGSAANPSTQGLFDGSSLTVNITNKWL